MKEDELIQRIRVLEENARYVEQEFRDVIATFERRMRKFDQLIEFYNLNIPLKYKKSFPEAEQDELFKLPKFKPKYPRVYRAGPCDDHKLYELDMPPLGHEDYKKSSERMAEYAKEKDKIVEWYWELYDENHEKAGEVLNQKEADKWENEGPKRYSLLGGEDIHTADVFSKEEADKWCKGSENTCSIMHPLRHAYKRSRKVLPKQVFSEACGVSSEVKDLRQEDKPSEPSPS